MKTFFVIQKLLCFMKYYLLIVVLSNCAITVLTESLFLCQCTQDCPLLTLQTDSVDLAFFWGMGFISSWDCKIDGNLFAFFFTLKCSYTRTACVFYCVFLSSWWKSRCGTGCGFTSGWVFSSVLLIFLFVWWHVIFECSVVNLEIRDGITSGSSFIVQDNLS